MATTENRRRYLAFSIDGQSMEEIRRLDNRVSYKFNEVSLRLKEKETHSGTTSPENGKCGSRVSQANTHRAKVVSKHTSQKGDQHDSPGSK